MNFDNNNINQIINNIPNINGFLSHLNVTINELQDLLIKYNFSLYHHTYNGIKDTDNKYQVSTFLIESDLDTHYNYSYENIIKFVFTVISIFYLISVLSFPYFNKSTMYYYNNINYIKYKILWPLFMGIFMVPIWGFNLSSDCIKFLFKKYKYCNEISLNNRYILELTNDKILSFRYGYIEDTDEYSRIYYKMDKYYSVNISNNDNDNDNNINKNNDYLSEV